MTATRTSDTRDGLAYLHDRLSSHFSALRETRDGHRAGIPIFALEHGLAETELMLLKAEVRSVVGRGLLPRDTWLPFVVYAAEVGYAYSGDEYWQTFEAQTPRWTIYGDRHYVRRLFTIFADTFGGARPSGAWADHFSIICWPITHAVLPTDLQRYLVRLLFEFRTALTTELLHDPGELGRRLAGRAWQASSRFQNFAQNTELLGQVSAALLMGDDEASPYLLDTTLRRIVADLSEEREARRWLRDAKATASHVRVRGLTTTTTTGGAQGRAVGERLPVATDPELSLRQVDGGWAAYVEFPDLAALAERLPTAHDELGRLRAKVAGVDGAPLARGRILIPGQRIRLSAWPSDADSLVTLENGSRETNLLLREQCVMPRGPRWLFRLRENRSASEVRGLTARPGRSYVLVSRDALPEPLPDWVKQTPIETAGVYAYTIDVPARVTAGDLDLMREHGVSISTEISVRPVGFAPALWDGEGTAEWNAGDDPLLAVSSSRSVERCIVALDGDPYILPWPTGERELFLQVGSLDVGTHELRIALAAEGDANNVAEGVVRLMIRTPPTPRSTGTLRQGLVLLATPTAPTLTELWDGKATLEIRGPSGVEAKVKITLCNRERETLAQHGVSVLLPLDSGRWPLIFKQIRDADPMQRAYEDAESCAVTVSHPELGTVSLRAEREFTPLRWVFRRNSDGPFARLIDNTVGAETKVEFFSFATPDRGEAVPPDSAVEIRRTGGGMLTATAPSAQASVILPPVVHTLQDLRAHSAVPRLAMPPRSPDGLLQLIGLAQRWSAASLPADPFGGIRRSAVLRAITVAGISVVCGDRWQRLERGLLQGREPTVNELRDAVGGERYQRELALDLTKQVVRFADSDLEKRARKLAFAFEMHARRTGIRSGETRFAEFLLRLASEPASLAAWSPAEARQSLQRALASPVLLRAARFVVLLVALSLDEREDILYAGWVWQ